MLSLTAACDFGSSSDPNAPVIANLRANLDVPCFLGNVLTLTLDYVDADGNVRGGILGVTTVCQNAPFPIPSPEVTISATTSGTITATPDLFCFGFGARSTFTVNVIDASAKSSNFLTIELRN